MQTFYLSLLIGVAGAEPALDGLPLVDTRGQERKLSEWKGSRLVVVAFLGVECPLARLYAARLNELEDQYAKRGVAFVAVDPNRHETLRGLSRFSREYRLRSPFLKDPDQRLARQLGVTRTPEVVLLDGERRVRYRGRIDDQYDVSGHRAQPTRRDLVEAIEDLLAGRDVRIADVPASGCKIEWREATTGGDVTYSRDVAPILNRSCVSCHRPGQVAPFSLLSYGQALSHAETIAEVVEEGRMPPWQANPAHGKFANDRSLSEKDRRTLLRWVEDGCAAGNLDQVPPRPSFPEKWSIPTPDVVVSMPEPFTVPADGVIEYQHIEVDPGFTEDRWVSAAEILPGNRAVVHHCTVFLIPPGVKEPRAQGKLGSFCLAATAPGTPPTILPDGMAKRIPAGWRLLFVVHYTPVGTVQTDRTSIGLVFADPNTVRNEVATHLLYDEELRIPPGAAQHRVEKSWTAPADVLLLSMFPHMHLRGKSFRYEALYPDGRSEILLDVPHYDFNWQHRYDLAEPKRLPAGTVLRCSAVYDNSAANPVNPDPTAEVWAGKQSWDEMFNGYFDWTLADQDLTRPTGANAIVAFCRALTRPVVCIPVLLGLSILFVIHRRLARRRAPSVATS